MAGRPRRRRGHAAASARILTAGLSSAAAFGMLAGMAASGATDNQAGATQSSRDWRPGPVALLAPVPARPAPAVAPRAQASTAAPRARAARPVTRTRGS